MRFYFEQLFPRLPGRWVGECVRKKDIADEGWQATQNDLFISVYLSTIAELFILYLPILFHAGSRVSLNCRLRRLISWLWLRDLLENRLKSVISLVYSWIWLSLFYYSARSKMMGNWWKTKYEIRKLILLFTLKRRRINCDWE